MIPVDVVQTVFVLGFVVAAVAAAVVVLCLCASVSIMLFKKRLFYSKNSRLFSDNKVMN